MRFAFGVLGGVVVCLELWEVGLEGLTARLAPGVGAGPSEELPVSVSASSPLAPPSPPSPSPSLSLRARTVGSGLPGVAVGVAPAAMEAAATEAAWTEAAREAA